MVTLANEIKVAAFNRNGQDQHPRNKFLRNTNTPEINEFHIKHVFEEIKGRKTKIYPRNLVEQRAGLWANVKTWPGYAELATLGAIWNRSRNISGHWQGEPGT